MKRRNFLKVFIGSGCLPLLTFAGNPATQTGSALQSLDLSLLLYCIAEVETGNNDSAKGKCGARSKYQIIERVWSTYRPLADFRACYGVVATVVAQEHLQWLVQQGVPSHPYPLAFAWHHGLTAWKEKKYDSFFAARVHNLYRSYAFSNSKTSHR